MKIPLDTSCHKMSFSVGGLLGAFIKIICPATEKEVSVVFAFQQIVNNSIRANELFSGVTRLTNKIYKTKFILDLQIFKILIF